jgi:hypothetical protein
VNLGSGGSSKSKGGASRSKAKTKKHARCSLFWSQSFVIAASGLGLIWFGSHLVWVATGLGRNHELGHWM